MARRPSIPSSPRDSQFGPRLAKISLGVMAVLAFVSAYSMVVEPAPGTPPPPRPDVGIGDWFPGVYIVLIPVGYLLMHRVRRQLQDLVPAITALREHRLADAQRLLATARAQYGRSLWLGPSVHLHEGLARLQLGDLDGAESSLGEANRRGWVGVHQDVLLQAAIAQAQVLALADRSAVGRTWLEKATQRRDKLGAALAHRGELLLAEMLLLVREGNFARAVALHDASAAELERTEPAHRLRLWWALAAYATWHMGEVRSEAAVEPLLRKLRASEPHELAHLVVRWPELRGFLETHGVAAVALTRGS